ncbi:1-phosphatidylinositol phosphodiesterase-like isoform 4-T4 [Spheniscus humboldti]
MAAFGINQAIFQPGMSAERSPWPRAEDESLMHVPRARQDARHDHHRVNGRHSTPPASVPPAPTAACPVQQAAPHGHRQTQQASLRGVLRRTLRFLRAHPGEAVLMRIKEELPIFPRPGFAARLHRCLLEEGQGRVWCREEVPTLGQVRGKIVVLEALAREVLGIPYEQLSISDAWNVLSLERKWARARRHLERAAGGDPTTMHLTFCSGNGLFTCPEEVARFVNPRCYQHLRRRGGQPVRWGVVIMDFPGAGLLRLIVESNAPWASGHITAAPSTPTVPLRQPHGRGDRCRSRHSSTHCPRRCPSGRTLLPAPRLCRRTSAPVEQKRVSSSCWAPGNLHVTMV